MITSGEKIFCVVCGQTKTHRQVEIDDVHAFIEECHSKKVFDASDIKIMIATIEYLMDQYTTFSTLMAACYENSVVLFKQIDFFKKHYIKDMQDGKKPGGK